MLEQYRQIRRAILGVALTAAAGTSFGADLRAWFDRTQVHEGDTLTLTIEKDGAGAAGSPDLSPLQKAFDVLGTSNSSQIRIVNGVRSDTTSWQITLSPKGTGHIAVAPITVGTERTPPLTLNVTAAPQGALGGPGDEVFVEVELGDNGKAAADQIMVQQQVPLTVRLYSARPLLGGDLSEPRIDSAVVAKLGEDRQYRTERQGREYQVVERRYSVSPEKSGTLHIPPIVFKGTVRAAQGQGRGKAGGTFDNPGLDHFFQDPTLDRFFGNAFGGRDPFGMFERGEPVRAQSRGLDLTVKARPEGVAAAHWLPAQGVSIADSWTEQPPQLRVGEPVTRTLTVTAKGLSGEQIPEIKLPEVNGLRIYPEKAETETRTDGETVFGVSRQTFTLIPSRGGALAIPAVKVSWWDTEAKKEQTTSLPGWNLQTEAAPANSATQPAVTAQTGDQDTSTAAVASPGTSAASSPAPKVQTLATGIQTPASSILRPKFLVGLALVLLGVLGAALLWRRRTRPSGVVPLTRPVAVQSGDTHLTPRKLAVHQSGEIPKIKQALRVACETNNPQQAANSLLHWAEAVWPEAPPRNLGALTARIAPKAAEPLKALETRLYGRGSDDWEGGPLWEAVKDGLGTNDRVRNQEVEALAPLYPARN